MRETRIVCHTIQAARCFPTRNGKLRTSLMLISGCVSFFAKDNDGTLKRDSNVASKF